MKINITTETLHPWKELEAYQTSMINFKGQFGATNIFIGTMRDFNQGDTVTSMTLEHYPRMTEKYLEKSLDQAMKQWDILDALLIHRVGNLLPHQPIVLIAVWAAHRKEAYESCRYIMEDLKSTAPFWKKEQLTTGSRWVTKLV